MPNEPTDNKKLLPTTGHLQTRSGSIIELPVFLPVYHPISSPVPIELWQSKFGVEACIVNAYFLYKEREVREKFEAGMTLQEHIGFAGLVMTDSGAFQGFRGNLYLKNKVIVKFQEMIGADVVSPLDLVTPPGDNRTVASKKWNRTLIRIKEALSLLHEATLAGAQQGGKFLDLRRQSTEDLLKLNVRYLALGSLVPFFNLNHNFNFVGNVIRDARRMTGPALPIHVYGAGDPLDLPFMAALGANVFDSSSYAHYAAKGAYMTPYGALNDAGPLVAGEYACHCPYCTECKSIIDIFSDERALAAHNLWTILDTIRAIRKAIRHDQMAEMLGEVMERHRAWFPRSDLDASWHALFE